MFITTNQRHLMVHCIFIIEREEILKYETLLFGPLIPINF